MGNASFINRQQSDEPDEFDRNFKSFLAAAKKAEDMRATVLGKQLQKRDSARFVKETVLQLRMLMLPTTEDSIPVVLQAEPASLRKKIMLVLAGALVGYGAAQISHYVGKEEPAASVHVQR